MIISIKCWSKESIISWNGRGVKQTVNRETVNREQEKSRITHHPSPITHHASPVTHHASRITTHDSPFTTHEILDLIRELAVVNLQSDIPEAIKYYKLERELLIKLGKPVPEIVERSIAVLDDYQYKVLVEGKYYKLEW